LPSWVVLQIDSPCLPDELRDHTEGCPSISPSQDVLSLRCIGAESARVRGDANPTKIEPVSIPAGLDRDVGVCSFMGMPGTSTVQEAELLIRQVEQQPPHLEAE
jgi:hypothetical protein